jgi:hypothetical protein
VELVPSVIESPKATTALAPGAETSSASRKNQEVVLNPNAASSSSPACAPVPGAPR